jgi:EAL domain-containing protein (putative c-di-GMP-specific phosphodiesterase class I)
MENAQMATPTEILASKLENSFLERLAQQVTPAGLLLPQGASESAPFAASESGRRHGEAAVLLDVLKQGISVRYQPQIDKRKSGVTIVGVECLSRGAKGTPLERPDILFEFARRGGIEAELDRVCISLALAGAAELPSSFDISVNLHASTLCGEGFVDFLLATARRARINLRRIVLELVEQQNTGDRREIINATKQLKNAGLRLAIDDLASRNPEARPLCCDGVRIRFTTPCFDSK